MRKTEPTQHTTVRLPVSLHATFVQVLTARDETAAQVLRKAIRDYVQAHEKKRGAV